jgi:uncharacterized protein with von Willebrand factor type A (vWA) domain
LASDPSGTLLDNLVLFGRLLRSLGMNVNPGRVIDLVQALEYVDIGRRSDFYFTTRSLMVQKKEHLPLFDRAFDLFWRKPSDHSNLLEQFGSALDPPKQSPIVTAPPLEEAGSPPTEEDGQTDDEEAQQVIEVTRTYSRREMLRQKDFSELSEAEIREVKLFMAEMMWELGYRRTRRQRPGRGRRLDLRRSLRRNLRYGGELLEWPRRQPKFKPRPLIVLADISGSMERYTRLLLYFIYSLAEGLEQQVEAFVFSTRLTRITRQLRGQDVDRALQEVSTAVHDWAGGTRIGYAVKRFNFDWARRVLGRGAVVLLISDGWDRGDPALLAKEMHRLQRSCHRLIWLNPLLGSTRYEPLTRGMQAALPYVDDFLAVHNLSSLQDLASHLARLTARKRPSRQQQMGLSGAAFISNRR